VGKRSRDKGKRGEREFAAEMRRMGFACARRGVQYAGGADSPDVVGIPGCHIEVKRAEALNVYAALDQAMRDADPGSAPIVAHRRNGRPWVVIVRLEDFGRAAQLWVAEINRNLAEEDRE
jgi:Holliday junction resolvase